MSRARDLSKLISPSVFSVDTDNNVGVNSITPKEKLNVVGIVSATSFFGDGSNLSGITAGATLSASSGAQRLVVTSLTSGTMTAAGTNADLAYNTSTNTLSATNLSGALAATNLIGTIVDARLGTVSSSKLSGALPALDGSALTNLDIPSGFSELDAALFN